MRLPVIITAGICKPTVTRFEGKASGKSFRVPFVHIATFREGRWVRFQNYTDTGTIIAALS